MIDEKHTVEMVDFVLEHTRLPVLCFDANRLAFAVQTLDGNFFRFVKFQRLLEAETGITQNEPLQLAVKDAIEKAVHDLIMEGIIDQYWGSVNGPEADKALTDKYLKEKDEK